MTLADRCKAIELLLLDVDGVLTEGDIVYADNDVELKQFHVLDGAALKIWQHFGKRSAIISGRTARTVEIRAAELGVSPVVQGQLNKFPSYQKILADFALKENQVCYTGDDVMDLSILNRCGLAVAVANARPEVLRSADYVTQAQGGRAAIREVVELILKCQGHWQTFMEKMTNDAMKNDERMPNG